MFCGKRAERKAYMKQDEINNTIVENANNTVLWYVKKAAILIFGRGQEEAEYAEMHGIETEIIPRHIKCNRNSNHKTNNNTKRTVTESV